MTLATFRSLVAAYMQRDETTFTYGALNLLTQAANMARRWAECQRNFELCRCQAQVANVHYQNGAQLSAATLKGTATSVLVKSIEKGFLPFSSGGGEFPIEVITRAKHIERVQRYYERQVNTAPVDLAATNVTSYFSLVRHGDLIYLTPSDSENLGSTTITVYLDIVKWLPEYSGDSDTDFFLDYCSHFMLLRTVHMLNFLIKEDQRMPVSEKEMATAWQSVIAWDSSMIMNSAEDASLD